MPNEVVSRAKAILAAIEGDKEIPTPKGVKHTSDSGIPDMLSALASSEAEEVAERLRRIDLNTVTPIEALNLIYELKKTLSVGKD